jgi:hypothetical protein
VGVRVGLGHANPGLESQGASTAAGPATFDPKRSRPCGSSTTSSTINGRPSVGEAAMTQIEDT